MSNYGGYGAGGGGGYNQANPYDQDGGRYNQGAGNPYAQQGGNPYAQQQQPPPQPPYGGGRTQQSGYDNRPQPGGYDNRYGGGRTQAPAASGNPYAGGNAMEMGPVNGQTSGGYNSASNQSRNAILNECRDIDNAIDGLFEGSGGNEAPIARVQRLQMEIIDDVNATRAKTDLETATTETMATYRYLGGRIKAIKQQKESGNPINKDQVGLVDRKLKNAINRYQQIDRIYREKLAGQVERQYLIVRPDASAQEVQEAINDTGNNQIFSQAIMSSSRNNQAQSVQRNVKNRHEDIQKIEKQMIELSQLFQDLEAAVVQQEPAVEIIDQKAEDTQMNIGKGNEQLDQAVVKARSARKKKWICLGICILIVLIIAAVIAVAVVVTNHNK